MKSLIIASLVLISSTSSLQAQRVDATKAYIDSGFAAMDFNKDGKVVPAEFDRFMRARLDRQAAAFDDAFSQADKDQNGTLSRSEAQINPAVVQNFAAIDSNKDGAISKEELRMAIAALQASEASGN